MIQLNKTISTLFENLLGITNCYETWIISTPFLPIPHCPWLTLMTSNKKLPLPPAAAPPCASPLPPNGRNLLLRSASSPSAVSSAGDGPLPPEAAASWSSNLTRTSAFWLSAPFRLLSSWFSSAWKEWRLAKCWITDELC